MQNLKNSVKTQLSNLPNRVLARCLKGISSFSQKTSRLMIVSKNYLHFLHLHWHIYNLHITNLFGYLETLNRKNNTNRLFNSMHPIFNDC